MFYLLPFSVEELQIKRKDFKVESLIFCGFYPRLIVENIETHRYYPNYIQTYIERDVRQLKQVGDLSVFQKFIRLCAGRVGQLVNYSAIADDCGVNHNTARSWMSLLEASFIVYLVKPHHTNFNKRLTKSSRLYFYDTGLVCSLLGIESSTQISNHYLKGPLFENFIVNELIKHRYNEGKEPRVFFWRDSHGNEVDLLIEMADKWNIIEIKSGTTLNSDYLKGLKYLSNLAAEKVVNKFLVYAGPEDQKWLDIKVTSGFSACSETEMFFTQ